MCMDRERNEKIRRRTGVTRVGWSTRAEFIEVVWTYEENGGQVDENSRI